jgi:hypothetical protein
MLVVFFLYNFIKYVLMGSFLELIWPTHYFNKKHDYNLLTYKFRSLIQYFLKIKNFNSFVTILNLYYLLFKKK